MPENSRQHVSKRKISLQQALEICFIVFEKNCSKEGLAAFQKNVIPENFVKEIDGKTFSKEWYAFVFAGIYYAFSRYAPAYMVLEYVRSIKLFLQEIGLEQAEITEFLDNQFQAYIKLIIEENVKECPKIFYKRLLGKELQETDKKCVMVLSGAMAMFTAACLDIFEKYEYCAD